MRRRVLISIAVILASAWFTMRNPAHGFQRTRAVWCFSTKFAELPTASVLVTNEGTIPVNLEFYKVAAGAGAGIPVFKRFSPAIRISPGDATSIEIPAMLASSREGFFLGLTEKTFQSGRSRLIGKIPSVWLKQRLPNSWLATDCFALRPETPTQ